MALISHQYSSSGRMLWKGLMTINGNWTSTSVKNMSCGHFPHSVVISPRNRENQKRYWYGMPKRSILCKHGETLINHCHQTFRMYSNYDESSPKVKGNVFVIPNPITWIKGKLYLYLITNNVDPDFTLEEFALGATQGICYFSHLLASNNFSEMKSVASNEVVDNMRQMVSSWTTEQQNSVEISTQDIQFSSPTISQLEVQGDCFIAHIDFSILAIKSLQTPILIQMGLRFRRKYTTEKFGDWTIQHINQFDVKSLD